MDNGTWIIGGITVLAFVGIGIAAATDAGSPAASPGESFGAEIEGVETTERTDRTHTQDAVTYERTPPTGGPHRPTWLDCNGTSYDEPVENELAVHGLEHGAVWISYSSTTATSTVSALEDKLAGYTFLSPVPGQTAPIKLTAWGNQLSLESADDPRLDQFLSKFRQGPQTPEPGATCNAPDGRSM
jgi:hypothetical protein